MELIHAKEAYAHTVLAKRNARRVMFEDLALYFNKYVNEAAAHAETAILLRWRDFDINEELATDEEALTELLNNVVAAGYEAEFCYVSPSAYNPCGIVVAWGDNATQDITDMFFKLSGTICRGE